MTRLKETLAVILSASSLVIAGWTSVNVGAAEPTAPTVPGPVDFVEGFALSHTIVMTWDPPASDGASPITGYIAIAGGSRNGVQRCATTGALSCVIGGLNNNTFYSLHVRAINALGKGPQGKPRSSTAPSRPECAELYQGSTLSIPNLNECDYAGRNLTDLHLFAPVMYLDDLSDADLSGSDIFNGNLTGADLSNANLNGAAFPDGVNLDHVVWSNTICPDGTNSNGDGGTCTNDL